LEEDAMRKFLLTTAVIAVALAVVLPARAEGEKKVEKPKQYTGEITKVDATSVTVKKKEGDEKTFSVAEKAKVAVPGKEAGEISDLKVGDKVTVFFKEEAGKEVAHKIVHADAKPKKEKKEEAAK
jgi:Cu/Ag efflux protein CusF